MSRRFSSQTGEVAVGSGSTVTVVQVVAPSGQDLTIHEISLSIKGEGATEPKGLMEAGHTDGAGTLSSLTPKKFDRRSAAARATAGHTATVEPTYNEVPFGELVHNQGGYTWRPPGGIKVQAGEGFAIKFTNNHGSASRNVVGRIVHEE